MSSIPDTVIEVPHVASSDAASATASNQSQVSELSVDGGAANKNASNLEDRGSYSLSADHLIDAREQAALGPFLGFFFKHYGGTVDLYDLRSRDGATGLLSLIPFALDVGYYIMSNEKEMIVSSSTLDGLYWSSFACKVFNMVDYLLRIAYPSWCVCDRLTQVIREAFPKTPQPFPMAAVLPRYIMYFGTFVLNFLLRVLIPSSFGVLLLQGLIVAFFIAACAFHMCILYSIFYFMIGGEKKSTRFAVLMPKGLTTVDFTAMGPKYRELGDSSSTTETEASQEIELPPSRNGSRKVADVPQLNSVAIGADLQSPNEVQEVA